MQVEEVLTAVEQRLDRGYLSKTEAIVFRQCWEGRSYLEIAKVSGYDPGYIKDIGYRLWQRLSEAYGEKVTKQNFKGVLRRVMEHDRPASTVSTRLQATQTLRQDWGDAIDVSIFYGRTQELATALLHKGYELEGKISRFSPSIAVSIAMKTKPKPSYRVRNWSEYDAALKQRGSLTFWLDEAVIECWINEQRSGRRGASKHYSDGAIALMATVQSLFNLAGRQTEGFLESLFALMGIDLPVPDHSTLCRRLGKVVVEMPVAPSKGAIHLVVDSTGVKVYGEGEWKVRQHGVDKRRTWRKLHVGVNEATGEILAAVASTNNVSDDEAFADVIDGIDEEIEQVSGDGAYDKRKCYDKIAERGAKPTIPPRKDAVRWEDKPDDQQEHPRNQVLERIDQVGRQEWKHESGYHRRSLAETTMFRFKTIFGATLRRRLFDNQAIELFLKCAALNRMIQLGKPNSCKVEI